MTELNSIRAENVTLQLLESAKKFSEDVALIVNKKTVTYRELDNMTWKSAAYMHSKGVQRGDIVMLSFTSQLNFAVAMLGAARLGATGFSIPLTVTYSQRVRLCQITKSKYIFTDSDVRLNSEIISHLFYVELLSQVRYCEEILDHYPNAPCLLGFGSGSTGDQKLIPVSHDNTYRSARYLHVRSSSRFRRS